MLVDTTYYSAERLIKCITMNTIITFYHGIEILMKID